MKKSAAWPDVLPGALKDSYPGAALCLPRRKTFSLFLRNSTARQSPDAYFPARVPGNRLFAWAILKMDMATKTRHRPVARMYKAWDFTQIPYTREWYKTENGLRGFLAQGKKAGSARSRSYARVLLT